MTQNDNKIKWESRYDAWKDSGLNVAAWCREQGVNDKQMYYWIQKFKNKNSHPQQQNPITSWMPMQLDSPITDSVGEASVFIHFDSISVEVRPEANMTVVSSVVNLLRKPC